MLRSVSWRRGFMVKEVWGILIYTIRNRFLYNRTSQNLKYTDMLDGSLRKGCRKDVSLSKLLLNCLRNPSFKSWTTSSLFPKLWQWYRWCKGQWKEDGLGSCGHIAGGKWWEPERRKEMALRTKTSEQIWEHLRRQSQQNLMINNCREGEKGRRQGWLKFLLEQLNVCWYHSLSYQQRKKRRSEILALHVLCVWNTHMEERGPGAQEG